jgi:glycosyltransferase involved in cell wall biosynthesis
MPPKISVLLPCRNVDAVLEDAAVSLRVQTLSDFEVVAVDDGSTDCTWQFLLDWAASDPRVRPLHAAGRGIAAALATAQAYARGELIARMDADDIADPGRLEAQAHLLQTHPKLAGCGTHVRYFPRSELRQGALRYEAWLNGLRSADAVAREIFVECPIAHPTLMLRRSALLAVGGYREMGWPEDYDLVLRLWATGHRLAVVPEVLLHWRDSPERASRRDPRYEPAAFRRCKVHFLARTLAAGREIVVWGAGRVGKAFARELVAQGVPLRAFVDLDPRKIGQEVHGVEVVAPDRIDRFRDAFAVAAVGSPGARAEIRQALDQAGWVELRDYCAVA